MAAISNALVIGGGIGGLTAAIALRKRGVAVHLIEMNAVWTVYGVGIIQPNNTLRALDRIGLARRCVENGTGFGGWRIHDKDGRHLMDAPNSSDAAPGYPPVNGITRPLLHKILTEEARAAGTDVRLGLTAETLDDQGDEVAVRFSDGTEDAYDFVIGADGIYSKVREHLFGDADQPRYTGQVVWRYNLPRPADVDWGRIYYGPDTKVGLVPVSPTVMYMFLVTAETEKVWTRRDELASLMRDRLAAYTTGLVAELRPLIVEASGVVCRPMENIMLPSPWGRGRIMLIGDAAHATTPHLAQGAAMAIEDAVLLGELLGRDAPLPDLLGEFMRRRYDRAKFVVDSSTRIAGWELEEWSGVHNPEATPGPLLHQATMQLMADY